MSKATSKRPRDLDVETDEERRIVPTSPKYKNRGIKYQPQRQVQKSSPKAAQKPASGVQVPPLAAGTSKAKSTPPKSPQESDERKNRREKLAKQREKWRSQMPQYVQPREADLDPARYRNVEMQKVQAHERRVVIENSLDLLESSMDFQVMERTFALGELVWARCKGYPFFPAMVCLNPLMGNNSLTYEKVKNGRQVSVHLLYFGDEQYMHWAPVNSIKKYEGWETFRANLLRTLERSKSATERTKILQSVHVSSKRLPNWRLSVALAQVAAAMSAEERLEAFTYDITCV